MQKVSINIVTWNSMKFLPDALSSLREQTYKDFRVLIIDNGSTDGTAEFIKTHYPEFGFLRNTKNLGFGRAHNQGIAHAITHWRSADPGSLLHDRYIVLMNPDLILEPDFLEKIIASADAKSYERIGSFGGKLLRLKSGADGEREAKKSDSIDSTGIIITKSRAMKDRGAHHEDGPAFDIEGEVFGISGALVMYRASALCDIAMQGEYFDEDFFMYKEDVDIAWRLQNLGWTARYVPQARAYHCRSGVSSHEERFHQYLRTRRARRPLINFYSYRNHWLVLIKNDFMINFFFHIPFIAWYEFKKFIFLLIFETGTLRAIFSVIPLIHKIVKKRYAIIRQVKVSPKEIRKWFI